MPGSGDEVQAIKAGIMEIGDIFVLNKADREGTDRFEQQLLAMLSLAPERDGWSPPVVRTVATEDKGTADVVAAIEKFRAHFADVGRRNTKSVERWKQRLLELLQARLMERVAGEGLGEAALLALANEVADRKKDPYSAISEILARVGLK
jgi:LAO/AO transport system kinase